MEQSDHRRLSPKATASAPPLGQLRLKSLTLLQYYQLEAAAALAATRFEYSNFQECSVQVISTTNGAALVLLNSSAIRLALMVPGSGGVTNLTWPGHWHCIGPLALRLSLRVGVGRPFEVAACRHPQARGLRACRPAGWPVLAQTAMPLTGACRRIPVA